MDLYPIDLYSNLEMFCEVQPSEIIAPDNNILVSNISNFVHSNNGRYTCRRVNSNTALVRVDIFVKGSNYLL